MGNINLALNESEIELVIVGADTSPKPIVPKKKWIDSIKHDNIHYKNNIKKYLQGGQLKNYSQDIYKAYED